MLTMWLKDYKSALLKTLLNSCKEIKILFTNILNSATNLCGVDSVLNGLKMLVMQSEKPIILAQMK